MTSGQIERIKEIAEQLGGLSEELDERPISNLFLTTSVAASGEFVLAANAEGFIYLASILASLAAEQSLGQHYHFDNTSVLSDCQKPLVIKFEVAPWERGSSNS